MQESFSSEHSRELLADSFEQFLNSSTVAHESSRHLESSRGDVANSRFDVARDPLHEVGTVLILNIQHLFINFLHRELASEHGGHRQVAT